MLARFALTNATIIAPDRLIAGGTVLVEAGRIADVVARAYPAAPGVLDVGGRYVLPGLVDLHNDALEREINPRPGANFDPTFALLNLDRKLAAAGVTTQFHAISFAERASFGRSVDYAADLCRTVHALRVAPHAAIENQVLHRLDLRSVGALDRLLGSLDEASIPLISLNDHVPGQGQYRDIASFRQQIRPYLKEEVSEADLDALVRQRLDRAAATETIVEETLRGLIAARARRPLILVSHDDDTVERVEMMHALGCIISEFPITVEAARRARELGMRNAMGAPNALRGGSLTGNASALDLLARGLVDILVADYHAPALLAAVFLIVARGLTDLPAAVRLVTAAPALAVGLTDRGAIEVGRRADLLVLDRHGEVPVVDATLLGGELRYTAGPFAPALAALGPAPGGVAAP
jgi:alpha-D-ribose 1-methylphosphonate 5-triphosphate diphosphatase